MISPEYTIFIHALATELDHQAGEDESNALLYSVGSRMAARLPLPECKTTECFELECNAALALIGWGTAELVLDQERRLFQIRLTDVPRVGSLGSPSGYWFASVFAGLFTGWFAQMGEKVTIQPVRNAPVKAGLLLSIDAGGTP
ncbi:cellulose biosynthesis protein BcsD [Asaia krungthepensis]|uniref:Cellulose synthase subunit D n=1 Tax=Asaia krungthepensis NRIC 0535 TaxID=1307925 RepID=A0ABQ0Q4U8_9PROT|nr:cellulose biosynthesis protein BcsD [Asaia krungthepensis]GBQ91528.1 hypothetical protein AA0535_2324 [Asaia krungthepensis NRIC 0535]